MSLNYGMIGLKFIGIRPIYLFRQSRQADTMSHTIAETRRRNPMWMYERNYFLLMQLFEDMVDEPVQSLSYQFRDINVTICKNIPGRYTHELTLAVELPINQYVSGIHFLLRVYHDARLVEVTDYQKLRIILPAYSSRNGCELSCADKKQINILLTDILEQLLSEIEDGEEVKV